MQLKLYTAYADIDRTQWRQLVEQSPVATFFQTEECYCFFAAQPFLKPFVFAVADEVGQLQALMCGYVVAEDGRIKRFFSRRAIVPGGVLVAANAPHEAVEQLLKLAAQKLKQQAIYLEIRNYKNFSAYKNDFVKASFVYQPHYDIHVDTTDISTMQVRLNSGKRRQLKAAEVAGLTWSETTNMQDIADFYTVLSHLYRTKVKRPLFPLTFFQSLAKMPFGKLLVVKNTAGHVVGGMACVAWLEHTVYEWFVCGVEQEASSPYVSVTATWAGLQYAADNGCSYFDFMGAGKPNVPYGVRNFKMQFGGELHEYGRFLYIENKLLYAIGRLAVTLRSLF